MNIKLGIFLTLIFGVSVAYADDSVIKEAYQESVEVKLETTGDMHVKHIIRKSDTPQQLMLIYDNAENISVLMEGEAIEFTSAGNNQILLMPTEKNITVEYVVSDELVLQDRIWTLDFDYSQTTSFLIPDEIDMVFANSKPIYLGEKRGIACHGCNILLEYVTDEPSIFKDILWEEDKFLVEIRTLSDIEQFEFNQPAKSIKFNVDDKNRFVTAILPVNLLGGPYAMFLDGEKTYFHNYINNGTHAWLNTRPDVSGNIEIIGTTVIPEFSQMIPLITSFLMLVVVAKFRRFIPQLSHTNKIHTHQS